jgi:hypothetical protein
MGSLVSSWVWITGIRPGDGCLMRLKRPGLHWASELSIYPNRHWCICMSRCARAHTHTHTHCIYTCRVGQDHTHTQNMAHTIKGFHARNAVITPYEHAYQNTLWWFKYPALPHTILQEAEHSVAVQQSKGCTLRLQHQGSDAAGTQYRINHQHRIKRCVANRQVLLSAAALLLSCVV